MADSRRVRPFALAFVLSIAGCGTTSPVPVPTPTATQAVPAKPTQPPLALPTHVRWAIDGTGQTTSPYFVELFYDGTATGFRVIDTSGQVVHQFPIAGSGIFGPETCMARARAANENATWLVMDQAALDRFLAEAGTYRVEAIAAGSSQVVILPLSDTGCRPQ